MEAVGIVFLMVLFVTIMTTVDTQKKKHYNNFTEVLDGDILSYECQQTGIATDAQRRTVCVFNKDKDSTYTLDQIREIDYALSEGGKPYSGGALRSMNSVATVNWREQLSVNKRSDLNILTDDIKNPIWKANVSLKSLSAPNHKLCERWMLIFKKYVF